MGTRIAAFERLRDLPVRHQRPSNPRRAGFTLTELLVIMALIAIVATLAGPNLLRLVQRSKLQGMVQQTAALVRLARAEAIRQNVPTVVRADLAGGFVVAFADVHGTNLTDPPDRIFNPIAGQPLRTTDYELGRYSLPARVLFRAPAADPLPVDGFTTVGVEQVAVFEPDGSIVRIGAFRLADAYDNFLEIRIEPQATGRVQIRKWSADDADWFGRNEGGRPWQWN